MRIKMLMHNKKSSFDHFLEKIHDEIDNRYQLPEINSAFSQIVNKKSQILFEKSFSICKIKNNPALLIHQNQGQQVLISALL